MTQQVPTTSSIRSMNSALSALRVLEEVARRQPIGVSDLARATDIPKSSVQRCLVTLQQAGWLRIVDADHARWGVTMKALGIGLRWAGEQDLRELATPVLKRLAAETNETIHLCLRDGADNLTIAREDGNHVVRVFLEIGTRVPMRASSAGVAMMAGLEPAEIEELLTGDLTGELKLYENAPLPTPDAVRAEIARTRERGYALNVSAWYQAHVTTIGAAIQNSTGHPVAGLALSMPDSRFEPSREKPLAQLVVAAADEITQILATA